MPYLGLKPVVEPNYVWVLYSLEKDHLVVHHSLVAFDIFLEYDLNCIAFSGTLRFPDDAISTRTQRPSKPILGPGSNDELRDKARVVEALPTSCHSYPADPGAC
jgi:hypothetical protein